MAQNRMKQQADKHRKEKEYGVGEWVYLKLQPYRQISVATKRNPKLSARYYGPYEIMERVGQVAYKLRLPENAQIHPVFHVSLLKSCRHVPARVFESLPQLGREGQLLAEPEKILSRRLRNEGTKPLRKCWSNGGIYPRMRLLGKSMKISGNNSQPLIPEDRNEVKKGGL